MASSSLQAARHRMARRVKAEQYRGSYHVRSLANLRAWNSDPETRCYQCGLTLEQVRQRYPKAKWHNGHRRPNDPHAQLDAWCSPCNIGERNRRVAGKDTTPPPRTSRKW